MKNNQSSKLRLLGLQAAELGLSYGYREQAGTRSWSPGGSTKLGGGSNFFFEIFTPKIGEDEPDLTSIFFKGIETTN